MVGANAPLTITRLGENETLKTVATEVDKQMRRILDSL
jgi:hypothetical protein